MISFDFDYYQADNAEEAVEKYIELKEKNKNVAYYNGGTEIVTYARKDKMNFDALIDIKNIPACNEFEDSGDKIIIGASITLNEIAEKNYFPLLSRSSEVVADHTTRNHITLGGNLLGRLPFKEPLLPLLVAEAEVTTFNQDGYRTRPITEVFDKRMVLDKEEILLQITVDKSKTELPYFQTRKVKQSEIDYPILHIAALKEDEEIKFALSSLCPFPFRSENIEEILNDSSLSKADKIDEVVENLPVPINSNLRGGKEYKEMLFRNSLQACLDSLGGAK
jgi:CO/xanthine dehydrogenase FAD-binding subunit